MTSHAFETTPDDLQNVLQKFGVNLHEPQLGNLFERVIVPEEDRIESAALDAKTTDDDEETLGFQTLAAQKEIAEILMEENELPAVRCSLCQELAPSSTAHIHQRKYIGDDCCWDERLRSSE